MVMELIVLASSYCDARISNGSKMDCQAPDGLLNFFFDHIINEFGIILIYSLVVF